MDTTRIGHYTIVSELGRGGMGVVYKAHEESLNRFVAIKVLSEQLASDPSFVARFVREARAAAALSHPNIIQIFYIGEDAGRNYFVMEYVTGQSLLGLVRERGKLAGPQAAQFMLQAAHGLAAAHDVGVIHRDIKPANLMVDDRGLLKIADFGLALPQDALTRLTTTGMLVGTPGYLSPEQCRGDKPDARSDIYSLGVTFFETLTGRLPFQADSPLAMLRKILDEAPPDVTSLVGDVDPPVHDIVHKMLAKDRGERYQDCHALAADLEEYLVQKGVRGMAAVFSGGAAARPPAPPPPSPAVTDGPAAAVPGPQPGMATQATVPMESGSRVQSAPPQPAAAAPAATGSALVGTAGPVVAVEPPRAASHRGLLVALLVLAAVAVAVLGLALVVLRLPVVTRLMPGARAETAAAAPSDAGASVASGPAGASAAPAAENAPSTATDAVRAVPPPPSLRGGSAESAHGSRGVQEPAIPLRGGGATTAAGRAAGRQAAETNPPRDAGVRDRRMDEGSARGGETALHGVAVVAVGEEGIAAVVASNLAQELSGEKGAALDASTLPEFEDVVGGGASPRLGELLRAARAAGVATLVVARLEAAGERQLNYMGRYDVAYRTRAVVTCYDVASQRPRGPAATSEMEYTALNRETVVAQRMSTVAQQITPLVP